MINGILEDLKLKFKTGTIATKIIYINVVLFFLLFIIENVTKFNLSNYLELPKNFDDFILKPWTILTYSWLHGNIWHLLFNMLLLYYVSQIFLRNFRDKNLLVFYLFGGIAGGVSYLLIPINNITILVGSSASVISLLFAVISYNPKMPIRLVLIPTVFPILYVGYFLIGLDLLQIILKGDNIGGSISHLGGMAFGYLYMKQFEKGNDFLGNLIYKRKYKSNFKVYKNIKKTVPKDDYEYNHQKVEKQKRIDEILDKISKSGYENLSKEDKDFLFRERG